MLFIGIDTSAYTTSVALIDQQKQLIWEKRQLLKVRSGERGLAQSEAFFQHVQNLPSIIQSIPKSVWNQIAAVGVSTAPRPLEGSYMPVFTAGMAIATSVASVLEVELIKTTHQEGHLAAGIESAKMLDTSEFLAFHVSGGTTELLRVQQNNPGKYCLEIIGGSSDLHAGQFIDRVGVRLGLSFPAGKELEQLALKASPGSASLLPSAVKGTEISFSGVESAAQRLIDNKKRPADLARAVEGCIVRSLIKVLEQALEDTQLTKILFVGGVMSNKYIRYEITKRLSSKADLFWAEPNWSSDNAIGVALLAREAFLK
ncbi:MAG: O-sialoglycoprotein endopeptidase [Peptococcaceae bacterium]|nr:O-sialoglycoprotein endopeptidase [Peptococcaceae bacterium]